MKFTLILYCSWLMLSEKYIAPRAEVELVPRSQKYLYESLWWELNPNDYKQYCDMFDVFNYLKILDEKNNVQYSGKILTPDELQDTLKVITLQNISLND